MKVRFALLLLPLYLLVSAALASGCAAVDGGGASEDEREAAELVELLALAPGQAVADVGAGDGEWAVYLAGAVGTEGRIFATEVDDEKLEELEAFLAEEGLSQVAVVRGDQLKTGLPASCCDAVLLRRVYHHFTDPEAMNRDLFAALEPGGLLAVVDYTDHLGSRVDGVPENRTGHGLALGILVEETTAAGFEVEKTVETWQGHDNMYCLLLRRP